MRSENYSSDYDETSGVMTLSGEIDETAAAVLRDELTAQIKDRTEPLVVDLSAVDYLPSAAIGVLARAQQQATEGGGSLDLLASPGTIAQRVLVVCGLPHRTG